MTKASAALGSAIFFIVAPGFVAGLVPYWISRWHVNPPLLRVPLFRAAGAVLLAAGILGLLDSFARFAITGLGTPAPVLPTESLVTSGLYRYVRNPMYVAALCVIFGQGLLLGNIKVLGYGALVWLPTHLFVRLYEEPTLKVHFRAQYDLFCAEVPRWIPRFTPWKGDRGS